MALQLNLTDSELGVPFPAAYVRVATIGLDKTQAQVMVHLYANISARTAAARPIGQRYFVLNTASLSGDILPAVYAALKALPEFAGAQDC